MRREDIYRKMRERSFADAEEYRETCERHGHSMREHVRSWDREDVQDGCSFSYTGDRAVEAAREIRYEQARKEREQEEDRQRLEADRRRFEQYERERQMVKSLEQTEESEEAKEQESAS